MFSCISSSFERTKANGSSSGIIDGKWRTADAEGTFHAENPAKGEALPLAFPTSRWSDCDLALSAANNAAAELRILESSRIADFLEAYATNIEAAAPAIIAAAAAKRRLFLSHPA